MGPANIRLGRSRPSLFDGIYFLAQSVEGHHDPGLEVTPRGLVVEGGQLEAELLHAAPAAIISAGVLAPRAEVQEGL